MKSKLILIASILVFGFSCAQSQPKETQPSQDQSNAVNASAEKDGVKKMTQAQFLSKVFDYKLNKDQWKYKGDKPCIIDFYADWCAPCRKVAPIMDELAKEYKGKVEFYKVDVEREKELARDLGIQSLPTLLYCPVNGEPQVIMGLQPKQNYIQAIKEIFNVQ